MSQGEESNSVSNIGGELNLEQLHFNVIDKFLRKPHLLIISINSVDHFYEYDIPKILSDLNPIKFSAEMNQVSEEFEYNVEVFFGGKNLIRYTTEDSVLYEGDQTKVLYPNEARLRNITYGASIHVDIDVVFRSYKLLPNSRKVRFR